MMTQFFYLLHHCQKFTLTQHQSWFSKPFCKDFACLLRKLHQNIQFDPSEMPRFFVSLKEHVTLRNPFPSLRALEQLFPSRYRFEIPVRLDPVRPYYQFIDGDSIYLILSSEIRNSNMKTLIETENYPAIRFLLYGEPFKTYCETHDFLPQETCDFQYSDCAKFSQALMNTSHLDDINVRIQRIIRLPATSTNSIHFDLLPAPNSTFLYEPLTYSIDLLFETEKPDIMKNSTIQSPSSNINSSEAVLSHTEEIFQVENYISKTLADTNSENHTFTFEGSRSFLTSSFLEDELLSEDEAGILISPISSNGNKSKKRKKTSWVVCPICDGSIDLHAGYYRCDECQGNSEHYTHYFHDRSNCYKKSGCYSSHPLKLLRYKK